MGGGGISLIPFARLLVGSFGGICWIDQTFGLAALRSLADADQVAKTRAATARQEAAGQAAVRQRMLDMMRNRVLRNRAEALRLLRRLRVARGGVGDKQQEEEEVQSQRQHRRNEKVTGSCSQRGPSELLAGERLWSEVGRALCTISPDLEHEWATWVSACARMSAWQVVKWVRL